jgi:hypothetical protein
MSQIANQLTLDGLADGTLITKDNTNADGNVRGTGATWVYQTAGAPTPVTEGHGARFINSSSQISRFDVALTAPLRGVRAQFRVKKDAPITGSHMPIFSVRTAAGTVKTQLLSGTDGLHYGQAPSGQFNSGQAPITALGDVLLIDFVAAQSEVPTSTNGRVFWRIKNLTNPTWNGTGEYFYDSGFTRDLGTEPLAQVRFGIPSAAVATPGLLMEYMGVEPINVLETDTSADQAKAYFADTPVDLTPLPSVGNLAVVPTRPTTPGGTDGKVVVTWNAVSGASGYEARIAPGTDATTGWTSSGAATSPKTFSGLAAGPYTVQVRAKA